MHLCVHQCLLWWPLHNSFPKPAAGVVCSCEWQKGSVPKLSPKAERVKLETDLVRPLQDCAVTIRAHLSVVYCIMNACTVCVCSTDSVDHLFLVCAFVFASAIIDYNSYSFGECAICITYIYQTELAKKCISSACLYMCVYNSLADFPCVYMQWIKVVGPDTCATVHAQTWSLSTGYCNILQLHW